MLDHIAVRQSDVRTHDARSDFITSYRATAACTRELGRLHDEIVAALGAWRARFAAADATVPEEPVIRRSPARCLVQLGPVALTVAWLQRAQGTVADGELLAVVWRGEVAMRTPQSFERSYERAGASSATALWETVLVASAPSEILWGWASPGAADDAVSSATLAARCVERLCDAYVEGTREQ
jgi:hypothetical protein